MYAYRDHYVGWHGAELFWWLFLIAFVAFGVFAAVWLLRAGRFQPQPVGAAPHPGQPLESPEDPAIREIRLRYARGEIDRDAFIATLADLGGSPPPGPRPADEK